MEEVWKPIPGYEGFYEVSDFGNIRRNETITEENSRYGKTRLVMHKARVLKPGKTKRGYLLVVLCRDDGRKSHVVHRLVASAFCKKVDGCEVVNHIDGNKTNNRAENLEWCTQKDNVHHAIRIGAKKLKNAAICEILNIQDQQEGE